MNRPTSMQIYKDIDLKLGIKSSLPKAKPTLALLILLWLSNDKSADLRYSVQDATKIRMSEECKNNLRVFIRAIYNRNDLQGQVPVATYLSWFPKECLNAELKEAGAGRG